VVFIPLHVDEHSFFFDKSLAFEESYFLESGTTLFFKCAQTKNVSISPLTY
jgi:hypothetical protein